MMMLTEQLKQFHEFALERLKSNDESLTLDQLYDEWRINNPESISADVRAVADSLADYEAGARGISPEELMQKLKSKW